MLKTLFDQRALKTPGLVLGVLLSAAAIPVERPEPTRSSDPQPPARDLVVHCGTLHVGDGRVLENHYLVVRDGRIERMFGAVSADQPNNRAVLSELPLVDASDKVVMPGLVAADTDLSGVRDDNYTITPDLVALDSFDFDRQFRTALEGGVTTVYLSPGRNRFVSGQGSVVKLAGDDIVERVLSEMNCLRVTFDERAHNAPPVFEPVISPTSDDPLEPARRQYPSSRISQLAELRRSFREALRDDGEEFIGTGSIETRYAAETLRRAARGDLPLRISAQQAKDIRRALLFADELGQSGALVIEDPVELSPVAGRIANAGAAAVLRMPIFLSASNGGGENRLDERKRPQPEAPGQAEAAGIQVALAPARNQDLQDLLMIAGLAVRHGMSEEGAIASVTSAAAELLGVSDRVGSLTPGHDADFLLLSGDPLAVGTMVEETWIGGRREFLRQTESDILAVRAGTILTGEGQAIRDGMVLISNGRIRGVGASMAAPYGARVIDLGPDAVLTPGFIDADSRLGLSGDGTAIPPGNPGQRIDEVVRHDDPVFHQALRGGVTTVLTSGQDTGLISGRIAAVKTGAPTADLAVLRGIVGQRFVFDSLDGNALKPIRDQIAAGKKYQEAWTKYLEELRAWESGEAEAEETAEEEKPAEEEKADDEEEEKPDPVTGTWECSIEDLPIPVDVKLVLALTLEGENVTGTLSIEIDAPVPPPPPQECSGTFKDGQLSLTITTPFGNGELTATIENDTLTGQVEGDGETQTITGRRTSNTTAAPKPVKKKRKKKEDDSDKPKAPDINQGLEPMRALLDGRATAVIRCAKAPAIGHVVELFRSESIRFVLHGAADALDTPEILGDDAPSLMVGPNLVYREDGRLVNDAARAADLTDSIALVTGDTAGSRFLPLHTAHAVRYGLDPTAALRSITVDPARMFGIDDAVGSIARGKHADLVVFDGNPFEPTSRVLMVLCNGQVALDNRQEAN
ncbi:MAG: amidohydrolase family protein [Planctomycetota bacterium]